MLQLLSPISRLLQTVERTILSGGILLMASLSVGNVLLRTFTGRSLAWAEELSWFALLAVTFAGLSHAAGQGRHIRMTAFYEALPHLWRRRLRTGVCLGTAALLGCLTYHAVDYVLTVRALGTVSPVLEVPLWLVYLSAPLGLGLGALQYLLTAYQNAFGPGQVYVAYGVPDLGQTPVEGI